MCAFAAVVHPNPCGGQLANGSRCVIRHNTDIVRYAGMRGVFCQPNNIELFRSLCQRIDNRFGIVGRAAAIKAGKYDSLYPDAEDYVKDTDAKMDLKLKLLNYIVKTYHSDGYLITLCSFEIIFFIVVLILTM